jgi:hypothetical protein
MLRAACGKQVSLALAGILAGAVVGLSFTDVAQAGRGGGGVFMVAVAAVFMAAGAAVSTVAAVAVSMLAVAFVPPAVFMVAAFILLVVFVVGAFILSTPRRVADAVTAYVASNPTPPTPSPLATRPTAFMAGPAFRTAPSQATAPSRTA